MATQPSKPKRPTLSPPGPAPFPPWARSRAAQPALTLSPALTPQLAHALPSPLGPALPRSPQRRAQATHPGRPTCQPPHSRTATEHLGPTRQRDRTPAHRRDLAPSRRQAGPACHPPPPASPARAPAASVITAVISGTPLPSRTPRISGLLFKPPRVPSAPPNPPRNAAYAPHYPYTPAPPEQSICSAVAAPPRRVSAAENPRKSFSLCPSIVLNRCLDPGRRQSPGVRRDPSLVSSLRRRIFPTAGGPRATLTFFPASQLTCASIQGAQKPGGAIPHPDRELRHALPPEPRRRPRYTGAPPVSRAR